MERTRKDTKESVAKRDLKDIKCWIASEGIAGTENQCLAVAERLGIRDVTVLRIGLRFPYNFISPWLIKTVPQTAIIDTANTGVFANGAPLPDLVIGAGRKAVPLLAGMPSSVFKVFIQHPHVDPSRFDLVAAPAHDRLSGPNVLVTAGAPTRVTPKGIRDALAASPYRAAINALPRKKIAVLIGGNSKTHRLPPHFADDLHAKLSPLLQSGEWGVMMTVSRRTPPDVRDRLHTLFSHPACHFWDGNGDNPYMAYLGAADAVLVTEDSVSMLCDAASTGKTFYRLPLAGGSQKFDRLYKTLSGACGLEVFEGDIKSREYRPLDDAQKIADEIKKRFACRDMVS